MFYDNFISRFILRKNFFKRLKNRYRREKRKLTRNEFDDMRDLFQAIGREPKHIFDCGANVGFVTHMFAQRFPSAQVHAFEPNPLVFNQLNAFHQKNPKVTPNNKGVGRESGQLVFNINKNSGTSSFLSPNDYNKKNFAKADIEEKVVDVVCLHNYMQEHHIETLDILKLDIEGFELEALKGMPNLETNVNIIYTEVNLIPTYDDQPLIEDIITYLRGKGFSILNFYGINENKYHQAIITNLMFISTPFKKELEKNTGSKYFGY
ncbi:MAG: FkbM family methyltransferase [Chitinophagaceae bacterium]|nr:FkbM family methyltransferase [Chitinophagaceae bacterium]